MLSVSFSFSFEFSWSRIWLDRDIYWISDTFVMGQYTNRQSEWYLYMIKKANDNHVSVYVCEKCGDPIDVSVRLSITDCFGMEALADEFEYDYRKYKCYGLPEYLGRQLLYDRWDQLVVRNVLTLNCRIKEIRKPDKNKKRSVCNALLNAFKIGYANKW